jgi:cell volume regulation protein A
VIVRDGAAIPPRGSTELPENDELHILVRSELRDEVEAMTKRWASGPIGRETPPLLPPRGAPQVFTVRPARGDGELGEEIDGIPIVTVLRSRDESGAYLVALADGRFAVTGAGLIAIGGRRALADWCANRAARPDTDSPSRAWWQEVVGALIARG